MSKISNFTSAPKKRDTVITFGDNYIVKDLSNNEIKLNINLF